MAITITYNKEYALNAIGGVASVKKRILGTNWVYTKNLNDAENAMNILINNTKAEFNSEKDNIIIVLNEPNFIYIPPKYTGYSDSSGSIYSLIPELRIIATYEAFYY